MKYDYRPRLVPEREIAVHDFDDAVQIAKILIKNGNVVMLSTEEDLTIINFIWSQNDSDRNDVVLMHRDDFEIYYREVCDEEDDDE